MPSLTKIQSGFMEAQGALPLSSGTAAAPGLKFSDHAGTGMFSPSTGAIGFSTSGHQQALTIDSSGNLIIGDANTNNANAIANDLVIGNTSSGKRSGITIVSNSGGDGSIFFSDGTGNDQLKGQIVYDQTADAMRFYTSNTQRLSIESSGKLEAYKGTTTTGKTSGSEAFTVGNGAGSHRFAVYPDGTTVIGGTGDIGNYNILLQNDGQAVFNSNIQIADSIFHVGDLNTRIRFPGNDTFSIETDGDERLRITSTGQIQQTNFNGIGFHMSGSGDPTLKISDTDGTNQHVMLAHNGGDSYIVTRNNTSHGGFRVYSQDGTSTLTRFRIKSDGNIGIGESNPTSSLVIKKSNNSGVGPELVLNNSSGSYGDEMSILFSSSDTPRSGLKGGITVDGQGSGWFSISTRNPSGTYGERIRVNSSGNLIVDAGGDAQDIQIKSHSASGGHGQIYLRGNASNESSSIKLNHYGHADYVIAAGRSGNGLLSITSTDGGTDGIIINNTGNVGIGTNNPTSYANSQASLVIEDDTNPAICISDTGQTRDWWLIGHGDGLAIKYATGGGSGSASNVISPAFFKNNGFVGINKTDPDEQLHILGNFKISRTATYNSNTTIFTSHTDPGHYGSLYHDIDLSTGGYYFRNNTAGTAKELWRIEPNAELRSSNITIDAQPWTHDTGGYGIFSCDNHANTFFGQNMRLGRSGSSGDHTLEMINQHPSVGGGGMYLGGNGNTNAVNRIRFYITGANQSPGTDVTSNYHWELRPGGTTVNYSFGKYVQYYTTVQNASTYVTHVAIPMNGSTAYEIRLQNSGNGISHIRCMASHWTSSYDLIRESYLAMDAYNNMTIHDQINRTSGTQGAWSFSRPGSGQTGYQSHLVINKSAGSYGGGMTGVIIIQSHRPWELHSIT
tara:strand:- start:773 stop:3472 length:2700 start_codon:yes stop_codon:yes gene_type:complete